MHGAIASAAIRAKVPLPYVACGKSLVLCRRLSDSRCILSAHMQNVSKSQCKTNSCEQHAGLDERQRLQAFHAD